MNTVAQLRVHHQFGYRFPVEGERLAKEVDPREYRETLHVIAALRGRIDRTIPRECECVHESRVAAKFGTKEAYDARRRTMTLEEQKELLCSQKERDENSNCAHANDQLTPNAYREIIVMLQRHGILDETSWEEEIFQLECGISGVDEEIASRRFSLPILGEEAKLLQRPNVRRLRVVRERLLFILDSVIRECQAAIHDAS